MNVVLLRSDWIDDRSRDLGAQLDQLGWFKSLWLKRNGNYTGITRDLWIEGSR